MKNKFYSNEKRYQLLKKGIQAGDYREKNGVDGLLTESEVLSFILNDGIELSNYKGHMTSKNGWLISDVKNKTDLRLNQFLDSIFER